MTVHRYAIFETANGFCGIAWSEAGISRFQLPTESADATERLVLKRLPAAHAAIPTVEIEQVIDLVRRYFTGEKIDFSILRLDISGAGDALRPIYAAARRIGWGQTTTYGTIAGELGLGPEGARVVGQAMAKNPVALIIPCHRVLAAGGKLGGFSAPGGAFSKQHMLELEGTYPAPAEAAQQSFGF